MRQGLFLSRHHGEISSVIDVDGLAARYSDLSAVRVYDHFFGMTEQRDMLTQVKSKQLDAVVLAGHSANWFETSDEGMALVQAFEMHGVNQNRIVFTNLYEQVARVHADQPANATNKARLMIEVALAKSRYCQKVDTLSVNPVRTVLVIGTSPAGLAVAQELLTHNYTVALVEKSSAWRNGVSHSESLNQLRGRLESDQNVQCYFGSTIADMSGWHGEYNIVLQTTRNRQNLQVGAIVICAGEDRDWMAELRPKMRLDTDRNGRLINIEGKLSNGRTREPGIWCVSDIPGEDHMPLPADAKKIVQSLAAALDNPRLKHPVLVSEVDGAVCGGCGTCVKTCAFSASGVDIQKKIAVIDVKRCRGCGNCVTACPTNARDLITFPSKYVNSAIKILSEGAVADQNEPKVLAFLCKNSGYLAADAAGSTPESARRVNYAANVMPLRVECAGNIDTVYILDALKKGFDGVALVICKDNHCHNVVGNTDMERRVGLLRAVLRSRGIDDNRVRIIHTFGHEGERLNAELKNFSKELQRINRQ